MTLTRENFRIRWRLPVREGSQRVFTGSRGPTGEDPGGSSFLLGLVQTGVPGLHLPRLFLLGPAGASRTPIPHRT